MAERTIDVEGMACTGCEQTVEDALADVEGVAVVSADHEADTVDVVVEGDLDEGVLVETIHEAGYEVVS